MTQVFAQNRTVTGTVTAKDDGLPIPGVTVKIKGTVSGTQTNAAGKFVLSTPTNSVLIFSFVGYATLERTVTGDIVNVSLEASNRQLNEVVVTALGIQRKADNLSYAQQGVKGEQLTSTRQTDINQALAGKIAGVQVRSQSNAKLGSQALIRLRGAATINEHQPLFVVDGTPVDDINFINMDDVEDVQVLKGPSATALYGQRADAGVLMITSRKAKKQPGVGINFTSTVAFNSVSTLPKYQNEYSGGTAGAGWQTFNWADGDPVEWKALDGKKYHTYFDDASWGPKMDGSEYIPWYAWIPGTQYSFKTAKLTPQPNNVRDFYNTGRQLLNNINFGKAGDGYNARVSYTNQDEHGEIPGSWLKRNFIQSNLSYDLSKHFTVSADINYVNQRTRGEFSDAYGNNASGSFNSWFHRDLDINILKQLQNLRTPTGKLPSWNLDDSNGINANSIYSGTLYWTNPYAYFNQAYAINTQDRIYGNIALTYKLNDHFKVSGTVRKNQRNTHYESFLPTIFEISTSDLSSPLAINEFSTATTKSGRPVRATYDTYEIRSVENNYEVLASYNQKFGDFNIDANIGGNDRYNSYSYIENGTKGGLIVPDVFAISNSKVQPGYYAQQRTYKEVRSVYGRASVNWNDILVADFSLRNDWSSALPKSANSYLYPSVGLSALLTKYVTNAIPAVSFLKVRGNWAKVGSDLDPYNLSLYYTPGAQWNGAPTISTPDKLIDGSIKPSLSTSAEGGLDIRFLNDRLGFSGTYYSETKKNEIVTVDVSSVGGFTQKLINAGKIQRKGVELTVDGYPVKTNSFSWNISTNFARNKSKVLELAPGIQTYYLGGADYSSATGTTAYAPGVWAIVGGEYGQIRGRGIQRINGQPVIDPATGLYAFQDNMNFGSVLPQFTGGMVNTFKYKNFSLNFTVDFSKGGKYFSLSDLWGGFSGLYQYTAGNNDKGRPLRDPVADGGGVHVKGVDKNGAPVDMYVDAIDYYDGNGANKINEMHIFDLSYVKLREANIGYTFNLKGTAANKFIQNLTISAFGRNLWLIYTKNRNFDPSEFVNAYGESGQLPPSRTLGLTLKAGF
ncbi:SusC/RagA family TonB-linked outer membrane protein [Mucilaginibacter sp. cycad4]|uniref:SusC/RagA family TonB-linked outer membrane protein n=1 Tax=Mucilaginibacter sp. cycad4 TaxID=3342096 RepID=UPI002AAC10CA|nr:SusC/RagA family TonB-linked outer membrane protein [Mucilaginibacter gossypii]WPU99360.1 SusC/RagA family TonB-linked outer membrane protein [Mucilaginibacter gossypii]